MAKINVNEQVRLFTKTIQNNPIPHKTIAWNQRNPPWIDEKKIKKLFLHEKRACNTYSQDANNNDF